MEQKKIRTFVTYIEAGMGHIVTSDDIAAPYECVAKKEEATV